MMEILKAPVEKEEQGDEFELSLELSIGGSYGKSENFKKIKGETRDPYEENDEGKNNNNGISRSDVYCGIGDVGGENVCNSVDMLRRREIQALRRQEARKKREEKLKKSTRMNNVGLVEDKLLLEAQQFQERVQDREIREKDSFLEDSGRKKEKNGGLNEVAKDLNLSFNETKKQCLYRQVQYLTSGNGAAYSCIVPSCVGEREKNEGNVFRPLACRSYRSMNSSMDCDSDGMNHCGNRKLVSNGSLEPSSSAVSDYQSTSHKGGNSSDTGSRSSPLRSYQYQSISRSGPLEKLEGNDSSSQMKPYQGLGGVPDNCTKIVPLNIRQSSQSKFTEKNSNMDPCSDQTTSTSENPSSPPSKETSGGLIDKPPKPPNHNLNASSGPHMPCVSATGNGPNGKTITGFLYKYTKTEVIIMCVCHGSSFSPAEFVEHAGGIDITHPLRHITMVPSAFG